MRLRGNTFLVTGGGSGLGAACAREFTGAGASVVLADINPETGEKLAAELGERARFAKTDVTDEQSVQQAITLAKEAFGGLRGVVNCAGVGIADRDLHELLELIIVGFGVGNAVAIQMKDRILLRFRPQALTTDIGPQ